MKGDCADATPLAHLLQDLKRAHERASAMEKRCLASEAAAAKWEAAAQAAETERDAVQVCARTELKQQTSHLTGASEDQIG